MTQTEWIISLDDDLKDYEELFVGNARDGDRLIRCKDCYWYAESVFFKGKDCWCFSGLKYPKPDDYCSYAEPKEL